MPVVFPGGGGGGVEDVEVSSLSVHYNKIIYIIISQHAWSTPASLLFKGLVTGHRTVKWSVSRARLEFTLILFKK